MESWCRNQMTMEGVQKSKPLPQLICSPSGNYLRGSCTGRQLSPFFPKKRVVPQIRKAPLPWFPEHMTWEQSPHCSGCRWVQRAHTAHEGMASWCHPWREAPSWLPGLWNSWSGQAGWDLLRDSSRDLWVLHQLESARRTVPAQEKEEASLTASWVAGCEKIGGGFACDVQRSGKFSAHLVMLVMLWGLVYSPRTPGPVLDGVFCHDAWDRGLCERKDTAGTFSRSTTHIRAEFELLLFLSTTSVCLLSTGQCWGQSANHPFLPVFVSRAQMPPCLSKSILSMVKVMSTSHLRVFMIPSLALTTLLGLSFMNQKVSLSLLDTEGEGKGMTCPGWVHDLDM